MPSTHLQKLILTLQRALISPESVYLLLGSGLAIALGLALIFTQHH